MFDRWTKVFCRLRMENHKRRGRIGVAGKLGWLICKTQTQEGLSGITDVWLQGRDGGGYGVYWNNLHIMQVQEIDHPAPQATIYYAWI